MSTLSQHPLRRRAPAPVLILVLVAILVTAARAAVWTFVAPMNLPRSAHGVASLDGKLYAVGGDNGGFVYTVTAEVFNPVTNTWTNIASMPNNKGEHGVAAINGKVYAIGGWSGGPTNTVFAYNPGGNSWATVAPLNLARRGLAVATSGGKIYAIGGWNAGSRYEVEVYDPMSNSWSFVAQMNHSRQGHCAATGADGRIYVFGGAEGEAGSDTAEVYDPAINSWSLIAPFTIRRYHAAAVCGEDGKLYVMGGGQGGQVQTDTVEVYDPATNTWVGTSALNAKRVFFGAARVGGKIYAVGGTNLSISHLNSVEVYDAQDINAPTCRMNPVVPNAVATQVYVPITATDSGRGIAVVTLTSRSVNCRLECYRDAAYTQSLGSINSIGGSLNFVPSEPVIFIKALKNSGSRSVVELSISDGSLTTTCDPIVAELKIPRGERRINRSFKGIPDNEHYITVQNTDPGLTSLTIKVNGRLADRGGLAPGAARTLNVQHLMRPGKNNRVEVSAFGVGGAKALLVIADMPQSPSEHPHATVNQEFSR